MQPISGGLLERLRHVARCVAACDSSIWRPVMAAPMQNMKMCVYMYIFISFGLKNDKVEYIDTATYQGKFTLYSA